MAEELGTGIWVAQTTCLDVPRRTRRCKVSDLEHHNYGRHSRCELGYADTMLDSKGDGRSFPRNSRAEEMLSRLGARLATADKDA